MNDVIKYIYINFLVDKDANDGRPTYAEVLIRLMPDIQDNTWLEANAIWEKYKTVSGCAPRCIKR